MDITELGLRELSRFTDFLNVKYPKEQPQPRWATENEVFSISPTVQLRTFGEDVGGRTASSKVLIVTPQVNSSYIADFSPEQSLVRTLLQWGPGPVGVTDWQDPVPDSDYGIAESLEDIMACMELLDAPIHLVGLCQGGWQAAMMAALHPEKVKTLTLAAAPIDFHGGATLMHAFTLGLPFAFFESLVQLGGGVARGEFLTGGFNLLKPFERIIYNDAALFLQVDRKRRVARYQELSNWYGLRKDVHGRLYLEAVRELFIKNKLVKGTCRAGDRLIKLSRISCPLFMVAGTRDHITPPEQLFALEKHCGSGEVHRYQVDAGHIGVFMGRKALGGAWREIGEAWKSIEKAQAWINPLQRTSNNSK